MKTTSKTLRRDRGLQRKLQGLLPQFIRHHLIRNMIRIEHKMDPLLTIRIAQTQEELSEAYRILQESYEEMGYAQPTQSGMRITKYYSLPTTTTFIALWDGVVIGTMSIIQQSTMGLPAESSFNLKDLQKNGSRVAEISSLAIHKNFRHQRGKVFLPLCKFLHDYSRDHLKLDYSVITVNPAWVDFYEGYLLFRRLPTKKVEKYDFANGAPAVGLYIDWNQFDENYQNVYGNKPAEKNAFLFFKSKDLKGLQFPDRKFQVSQDPVLSPEMMDYFFRQQSTIFNQLSEKEIQALWSAYPRQKYQHVLPSLKTQTEKNLEHQESRFAVCLTAKENEVQNSLIRVLDVSMNGLRIQGSISQARKNQVIEIHLFLNSHTQIQLQGKICWSNPDQQLHGLQILKNDHNWKRYIYFLYQQFPVGIRSTGMEYLLP